MKFTLLTHAREIDKPTNTGQLVGRACDESKILIWQRTRPDTDLLHRIETTAVALVYPVDNNLPVQEVSCFDECILLDATWQEARKMYNHSPYLHNLPKIQIHSATPSRYHLRRNQVEGGLSTVESVIVILQQMGEWDKADSLHGVFEAFLQCGGE